MPVKHYGIYLAYPPTVDMRGQGLGRHLSMFLKGAEAISDLRFTIVCPSWTKETLVSLFESEHVSPATYSIVSPDGIPYALRLFEALRRYRNRQRQPGFIERLGKTFKSKLDRLWERFTERAVAVHDAPTLASFILKSLLDVLLLLPICLIALPFILLGIAVLRVLLLVRRVTGWIKEKFKPLLQRAGAVLSAPQHDGWILYLYEKMQKEEMQRMKEKIHSLKDVRAWYCPTAFWPTFQEIDAPRLMCVPDVVLAEFPAGFSSVGGDRFLSTFESVQRAIRKGERFVTYSQAIKWNTLVDGYAVNPSKIEVITHAPNNLLRHIEVSGFPDVEATSRHYCQTMLKVAMQRGRHIGYTATFQTRDVRFLFYASQFRPNKNVLMLLQAFEYLLRKRFLSRKLILTGRPEDMPEIGRFIVEHHLENDVLFLNGLSVTELAACYKLADLAVNPTLSEGGCPFTFSEALSVGTPVVMSRIEVTTEVLTDKTLQEVSLFDPYDWRDCANRIEWALNNRETLLSIQLTTYNRLRMRSWTDVVAEHVEILDRISEAAEPATKQ